MVQFSACTFPNPLHPGVLWLNTLDFYLMKSIHLHHDWERTGPIVETLGRYKQKLLPSKYCPVVPFCFVTFNIRFFKNLYLTFILKICSFLFQPQRVDIILIRVKMVPIFLGRDFSIFPPQKKNINKKVRKPTFRQVKSTKFQWKRSVNFPPQLQPEITRK